jgi:hypothetical protein
MLLQWLLSLDFRGQNHFYDLTKNNGAKVERRQMKRRSMETVLAVFDSIVNTYSKQE